MSLLVISAFSIAFSASSQAVSAAGCAIATPAGLIPDRDCDGVIDNLDNCPAVNNPDQWDTNRNGVGDACDTLIEEIIVSPDSHIRQGEMAHITVRVLNNRDAAIGDVAITLRNKDLGVDAIERVPFIPVGEMAVLDFWVSIPKCAKAQEYPITVSATFNDPRTDNVATEIQRQSIMVEKSNPSLCGTASGPLDTTIIKVFGETDIDRGQSALIPITIVNLGDKQTTYDLSVEGAESMGSWRIDSNPRVVIAAGHDDARYLYLQTESWTRPGTHTAQLIVASGTQKTVIPIKVYVRGTQFAAGVPVFAIIFQLIIIVLIIALIIIAVIIAVRAARKNGDGRNNANAGSADGNNGDHAVEPYYDDHDAGAASDATNPVTTTVAGKRGKTVDGAKTIGNIETMPKRKVIAVERAKPDMETYY